METWIPIGLTNNNYSVSNYGRVRNNKTLSIIRHFKDKTGYLCIGLYTNKVRSKYKIHRLVAMCFIAKIEGLNSVNHKDGDKSNNCVENLEWISDEGNVSHYRKLISSLKKEAADLKMEIEKLKIEKALYY